MRFFENPAEDTTIYPEHFQENQIARKVLRCGFSDKKYMFENIGVFDCTK